ncbi:phosphate/sulfate permease [Sanguibacter keddieii DSM 10542]|uniref:Phosphate/sulfate permease n=1 Tax=Sanguibacter keddieii (strain ATCC 51767 / DSM 10542 / NCFB 3025 / ST-74) TaxID=446469 RepID=D1BI81_SANKS|nr:inorganic phosphate transporter [Sanguibacter keddieii]ACZ20055.1 phosphate/sulfate permease [Sanguibacter keddieii DSM 10542]
MEIALLVAACLLALVYGSNAGATIAATSVLVHGARPWAAVAVLGAALVLAPVVLGTAVATTVAHDLVPSDGGADTGRAVFLGAVVAALVVTTVLSRCRQPTSLTLALVAGIAGAALGAGQEVAWASLLRVLGLIAVAPLAGAALARVLHGATRRWQVPIAALPRWHAVSYCVLCLAFGGNDAQKILAVVAVASAPVAAAVEVVAWQLVVCATLFSAGAALGLSRMERTVNRGVVAAQGLDTVITQTSTAVVMLLSSRAGSPVGMAQTLSGSLVGAGIARGRGKIRWEHVARIALAWVLTVPAAVVVGIGAARLTTVLAGVSDG